MNSEPNVKNAIIKKTFLGIEDHGFTFCLYLKYGSGDQGAGMIALDGDHEVNAIKLLRKILEVVGVDKWEDLPGRPIRALASGLKVHAIGHIVEERWVDFQTVLVHGVS